MIFFIKFALQLKSNVFIADQVDTLNCFLIERLLRGPSLSGFSKTQEVAA